MDGDTLDSDAVLDSLGGETARQIVRTVAETPQPVSELVDDCEASRATVYRTVNELCEAGLLDEHHDPFRHQRIVAVSVSRLEVALEDDIAVTVAERKLPEKLAGFVGELAAATRSAGQETPASAPHERST